MLGEVAVCAAHDDTPWSVRDVERRGLGGAETALARVAEELAKHGHSVTVYANVDLEETVAGVVYRRRDRFDAGKARAAVISSRAPEVFHERPAAGRTILWVHDPDAGKALTPDRAENIDYVVGLSAWHARRLSSFHPFAAEKIVHIGHGFDRAYFAGSYPREQRVVATCQPERGVDVLLELWPEVRSQVPEAQLVCCHAPHYESTWDAAHRRQVQALARQDGVRLLGPLSRPRLARLLLGSRVYAHPSWRTHNGARFYETFCIAAVEAQAAGLWVVASAWGALPETVRVGALIDGSDAPGPLWRASLVEQIVLGLTDHALQQQTETTGPDAVRGLGWQRTAEGFAGLIAGRTAGAPIQRYVSRQPRVGS